MYYLVRNAVTKDLVIWQTDPECDEIIHLVQIVHKGDVESSFPLAKVTSIAHVRTGLVAASENLDALVGAAAMELL